MTFNTVLEQEIDVLFIIEKSIHLDIVAVV